MGTTTDEVTTEELTATLRARRVDVSRDLDAIGDRVSPRRMVDRRRRRMTDRMHDVRDRFMGTAGAATDRMGQGASMAREQVSSVPDRLAEGTRGAPLVAGAIAFGAGVLVAATMPQTDAERRLVDEHRDELREAANSVKETASDAAHQAADHLGDEVRAAADDLKGSARQAADEVKGQARGATDAVTEHATNPSTSGAPSSGAGTTSPGSTRPGTTGPGTTSPGTTRPGTTGPGTTNPGTNPLG